MVRENIRTIAPDNYLSEREVLPLKEKALFDFLFLTGTRVSESLAVKKDDIDWNKNRVSIHTLKNPSDPYRSVTFFPDTLSTILDSVRNWSSLVETPNLWTFEHRKTPQTYVWETSRKIFHCSTHSFRHTNATLFCRAVRPNLNELMARYGWKDPKPALIYIKYAFDESLDEKINEWRQKGGKL